MAELVDGTRLESEQTERFREFESLRLRHRYFLEGKPDKRAGGASKALRRASYDAGRDRYPLPDRYYDSDSIIDGVRFYKDIVNAV